MRRRLIVFTFLLQNLHSYSTAKLDISGVYLSGHRWTGSSGSSLSDLKQTLDETQQGLVAPNHSVAAIGGLAAAAEGLRAVQEKGDYLAAIPFITSYSLARAFSIFTERSRKIESRGFLDKTGRGRAYRVPVGKRLEELKPMQTKNSIRRLEGKVALVTGAA